MASLIRGPWLPQPWTLEPAYNYNEVLILGVGAAKSQEYRRGGSEKVSGKP